MTREYRKTFKPVRILVAGKYKTVHTVLGAGKALLEFPLGDAQRSASRAVMDNFNDALSPQDVRNKFIAAASEAKLDVEF